MSTTPIETIERVPIGTRRVITRVIAPKGAPGWAQRLEEVGFIPGERIVVMARGAAGGDPMVVRVGLSTFALRRAEAACAQLAPADVPAD